MNIDPKLWIALRSSAQNDNETVFQQLVAAIVDQEVRDQLDRRTAAEVARLHERGERPWLASAR